MSRDKDSIDVKVWSRRPRRTAQDVTRRHRHFGYNYLVRAEGSWYDPRRLPLDYLCHRGWKRATGIEVPPGACKPFRLVAVAEEEVSEG